jgi:hypothetical protein
VCIYFELYAVEHRARGKLFFINTAVPFKNDRFCRFSSGGLKELSENVWLRAHDFPNLCSRSLCLLALLLYARARIRSRLINHVWRSGRLLRTCGTSYAVDATVYKSNKSNIHKLDLYRDVSRSSVPPM